MPPWLHNINQAVTFSSSSHLSVHDALLCSASSTIFCASAVSNLSRTSHQQNGTRLQGNMIIKGHACAPVHTTIAPNSVCEWGSYSHKVGVVQIAFQASLMPTE